MSRSEANFDLTSSRSPWAARLRRTCAAFMPSRSVLCGAIAASLLAPSLLPGLARAEEPLVLEEETALSDGAVQAWLNEGMALLNRKNYLGAASKFNDIVRQGNRSSAIVQDAQFLLGSALYELGLYQSAFTRFEEIVDAGNAHPHYEKTLVYLLKIARATGHDPSVLLRISEYPAELYPADVQDELHFIVGQFFYGEESLNDAIGRFQLVTARNQEMYARAKYLEGVIHVAQSGLGTDRTLEADRLLDAAESFKTVLRIEKSNKSSVIKRVAADAVLALGRLFYSTRQYDVAVNYYNEIQEENPNWLNALYEVSWTHFQLKNYSKALGNLHSVNSPYFASQYFPESRVLQALILFYNCHYDDADAIVAEFVNDYYPLMNQFRAEINQFADPNAFYYWLVRLSRAGDGGEYSMRFKRIFNAALEDKKLRRKFEFVAQLNDEVRKLEKLQTDGAERALVAQLKGDVEGYRSLVIGEAGGLAQQRLLRIVRDLQRHLGSALKIKGETLRARRGDISNAAAQEQAAAASAYRKLEIDDEHIEWPFEGEYWRDELGSYIYDISSKCSSASSD